MSQAAQSLKFQDKEGTGSEGSDGDSASRDFFKKSAETVSGLGRAGAAGANRKATAKDVDYQEFISLLLGLVSLLFIWWVTAGLNVPKEEREQLELDDEESDALAEPLSRILARSFIGRNYGHEILGGADYLSVLIGLALYSQRISPYLRAKINTTRGKAAQQRRQQRERVNNVPQRPSAPPAANTYPGPTVVGELFT